MKKVILITGGSRGIGAAIAKKAAREGYTVLLNYKSADHAAQAVRQEILSDGGDCILCKADVSSAKEVESLKSVLDSCGGADVLVNNAGVSSFSLLMDLAEDEWDRTFDTNVKGAFLVSKLCLPYMVRKKSGCILNISSIWGLVGSSCEVHYSASKAALIGMTKALAKEMGPSHIRVNCVAPGVIDTEMNASLTAEDMAQLKDETPLERIGHADEIADTVLFLASEKAAFITGQVISPNGGFVI